MSAFVTSGARGFAVTRPTVTKLRRRTLEAGKIDLASASSEAITADPLATGEWDRMVGSHRSATAFHSSVWAKVLTRTYSHKPLYLELAQGGETTALLPLMEVSSPFTGRRAVSLPFSDSCPPLTFAGFNARSLVDKLSTLAEEHKWKYFELRDAPFLRGIAPPATTFYAHRLDLTGGPNDLPKRFASNIRRNLQKAERSGVTVEVTRSREGILAFYNLLARTRRRHGLPPQSQKFFLNIAEHLMKPGFGFVVLARRKQRAIAGAVFFIFANNALYKYGASDERMQEFRANNLVMWEGIKHLAASGARSLHFGRTAPSNEGLRRFKLAWGAKEEIVEYYRWNRSTRTWSTAQGDLAGRAGGVFRRMPLAVNRLIGTMVYPHLD